MNLNTKQKRSDTVKVTLTVIVVIVIAGFLFIFASSRFSIQRDHELYIPSPGFSGSYDGLIIFFNDESIVDNRIKVILDGEVFWIRLEGR